VEHGKNLRTVLLICAALLLAVTTSASAASKIGGKQIKKNAIAAKHIKKNAVTSSEIKKNAVASGEIKENAVASGEIKENAVASSEIKNGSVGTGDLANGSVTANKIAPGAIAFPNTLWAPSLRNQRGTAESNLQAGPETPPTGEGSLRLAVVAPTDVAAFGNSFDFLGMPLADVTELTYSTYNGDAAMPRPSLRIEIDPHLVDGPGPVGALEFATVVHVPEAGGTGWVTHEDVQDDVAWFVTGSDGDAIGCNQATMCTLPGIVEALEDHADQDLDDPTLWPGVYFGLGSGETNAETAVDALIANGFVFDFEPTGVYLTPAS
jgi:hypothetical protein